MVQPTIHRYRAGMPQLAHAGLSENWLLKECGHRHWEALAAAMGRELPDFVDDNGARAYAAFTAVRVSEAALNQVREHDAFDIATTLNPCGPARHFSVHHLRCGDAMLARVAMSSTFVRREQAGNNQSVVRARFAALNQPVAATPADASATVRLAKALRAGRWTDEIGIAQPQPCEAIVAEFVPCPNNDFNGAEFLYFASFQAFVDRAEWGALVHRFAMPPALVRRDMFFHGNLNVGDTLGVRVVARRDGEGEIMHWCEVRRGSDRAKIADVVTVKRWSAP
jgi:probable biosynthetic protein (TIGR04099 family)